MRKQIKTAEDMTPGSAVLPLPQVEVKPTAVPGKKGPIGLGPRTNYSRVNSGTPPIPDAGAPAQKAVPPLAAEMLPKLGSFRGENSMPTTAAARPLMQDMIKSAMEGATARASVAAEALRQQDNMGEGGEKTAAAEEPTTEDFSTSDVEKLASALDFVAEQLKTGASLGGSYTLSENHVEPGKGPGALKVLEAKASGTMPGPGGQGHGHHQPPMHPGLEKRLPTEHKGSNMETNYKRAPGGSGKMLEKNNSAKLAESNLQTLFKRAGLKTAEKEKCCDKCGKEMSKCACSKTAADKLVEALLETRKHAEDAINPAQISAGAAVPPDTSAAGEGGGAPAGGSPNGPTGLVSSNQSAIDYKRSAAYANRKTDLAKYLTEPAMSSATDTTLAQAFSHTGEAGTKFAHAVNVKTAAARAVLKQLAEKTGAKVTTQPAAGA